MASPLSPRLAAHLTRHARTLFRIACGFGRERDGEDIIQTLYTRWWRRMNEDPTWDPPEARAELFVCVRRVVIDIAAKERRARLRDDGAPIPQPTAGIDESLHAFGRLEWILEHLPAPLAEALTATLGAGRRDDAAVAGELGLTAGAFTARLFKARRAAEELSNFYDHLSPTQATLMAELRYGGKSKKDVASGLGMRQDELIARSTEAEGILEKHRRAAS